MSDERIPTNDGWQNAPAATRSLGAPGQTTRDDVLPTRNRTGPNVTRRSRGVAVALMLGAVAAGALVAASTRSASHEGTVTISVSGPNDATIERFAVAVDGRERCNVAPCAFPLESGTHELFALADGYLPYEQVLAVASGSTVAVNITLRKTGNP